MALAPADYRITRLVSGDEARARALFATMADVFGEPNEPLGDAYVVALLARQDLWVLAASLGDALVGGLTAHTLPMTRSESREIFIYDLAVRADHQRRGVGRRLMTHLADLARTAGIDVLFVPADDEDAHALDFYRAVGGVASPVTIFTFGGEATGIRPRSVPGVGGWPQRRRDAEKERERRPGPPSSSLSASLRLCGQSSSREGPPPRDPRPRRG